MVSALWQDLQVRELLAAGQGEGGLRKRGGTGRGGVMHVVCGKYSQPNGGVAWTGGQRK